MTSSGCYKMGRRTSCLRIDAVDALATKHDLAARGRSSAFRYLTQSSLDEWVRKHPYNAELGYAEDQDLLLRGAGEPGSCEERIRPDYHRAQSTAAGGRRHPGGRAPL